MFSSVVLSLLLQQETGTEIIRSQVTIGGKVTIAQASSSLIRVKRITGSVLLPWCVLSCQRPQWNKLNPDTSLSEVPMYAHWQEAGPVFFSTLNLLLILSILTFLSFFLSLSGFTPFLVSSTEFWLLLSCFLSVQTLPLLYCRLRCAGPAKMLAVWLFGWCSKDQSKRVLRGLASVVLVA